MVIVHAPPNYQTIDEVWMFLSSDEGGEGICSAELQPGMLVPMMGADKARIDSLMEIARKMATIGGKKIKLVKFSVREDVMEIDP